MYVCMDIFYSIYTVQQPVRTFFWSCSPRVFFFLSYTYIHTMHFLLLLDYSRLGQWRHKDRWPESLREYHLPAVADHRLPVHQPIRNNHIQLRIRVEERVVQCGADWRLVQVEPPGRGAARVARRAVHHVHTQPMVQLSGCLRSRHGQHRPLLADLCVRTASFLVVVLQGIPLKLCFVFCRYVCRYVYVCICIYILYMCIVNSIERSSTTFRIQAESKYVLMFVSMYEFMYALLACMYSMYVCMAVFQQLTNMHL